MGRVEIVTLTVGARAKEGKGEGEGRKKGNDLLSPSLRQYLMNATLCKLFDENAHVTNIRHANIAVPSLK